ncbi:DUF2239 family protein [Chitinimonas arctica]|uniref:DUF2239 family protein n=1 Tax=Chitinimonas arctica TaxID=2594795 RepID=A0A516SLE1_9NEIS|nr:DUF2239 family protein [Chitinimonas arctica]QDQ28981.1 DUF2239 family protein [Chitinimonas arctica]
MTLPSSTVCIAFSGNKRIAQGSVAEVARTLKCEIDHQPDQTLLVFNALTSEPIELDLQGSLATVQARYQAEAGTSDGAAADEAPAEAPRSAGRPKLGVVPREVTLLPRHWEWLSGQPGGASVALRKLVEQALRSAAAADRARQLRDAAYRFMHAIAGNEVGFEAASRALFSANKPDFHAAIHDWPADIHAHTKQLADALFALTGEHEAGAAQ